MGIQLTVTAKSQITLRQSVMEHLGIQAGDKVDVDLLPDGKIEIRAASEKTNIMELAGIFKRPGQPVVTLEDMEEAIAAGAAGEPE